MVESIEYEQNHSPEFGLGASLICGPQLHPLNLRMLTELIWKSYANNLVLVKLHNNLTRREFILFSVSTGFNMFELGKLGVVYVGHEQWIECCVGDLVVNDFEEECCDLPRNSTPTRKTHRLVSFSFEKHVFYETKRYVLPVRAQIRGAISK